jgi:MFS family permease
VPWCRKREAFWAVTRVVLRAEKFVSRTLGFTRRSGGGAWIIHCGAMKNGDDLSGSAPRAAGPRQRVIRARPSAVRSVPAPDRFGGYARSACEADCGKHRTDRARGSAAQRHCAEPVTDTVTYGSPHWSSRLPFYYGWVIIGIAFVTMAIGVSARTAFSLLMPPLIDEFGWDRGLAAGAFSFGFLVSALLSPIVGRVMDTRGPRLVILTGVTLTSAGLLLAPAIEQPWHLYATLGVLVGGGANMMTYTAHSQFLPNWFVRRRGLAISVAFAGVGAGAVVLLPWLQSIILAQGWRASCWALGLIVVLVLAPLNLLIRKRPEDIGLLPDGAAQQRATAEKRVASNVVDPAWASVEWTLGRAAGTSRFWWVVLGYFCGLVAWYAVQVHQTKYLTEVGFTPLIAAWALSFVSVIGVPGQIVLGALSDRIGRALTSVMGPVVTEIFEGPHYGSIFGTITVALIGGGAAGPWLTGTIHDATGSYQLAFLLAIACCVTSALAIWLAAPRKVRLVPGRVSTH